MGSKKIRIRENTVILDIGCGGGKTIHTLSKMISHGKVYGIDYSEQAVENDIRTNRTDVEAGKVIISRENVSSIPFSDYFFDVITAFQTHYFWTDLENDIKAIFRVLKQEGCLMIVAEAYKIKYHMSSYKTKKELKQLFKQTGFNSVTFHEYNGWICMIANK